MAGRDAGKICDQVARSGISWSRFEAFSVPFDGWFRGASYLSKLPILFEKARLSWSPAIVLLGTGNKALRFGTKLKRLGIAEVLCIEPNAELWGAKRISGWEVERRRFRVSGRKNCVGASSLRFPAKGSHLFELRSKIPSGFGYSTLRVISVGWFQRASILGSIQSGIEFVTSLSRRQQCSEQMT